MQRLGLLEYPNTFPSVLKIEDSDTVSDFHEGMKIVGNLFEKYKYDEKKLSLLISNYNLSREIHEMIPPDLSKLSDDNIFEIFNQSRDCYVFKYLESNYGLKYSSEIQDEFTQLYKAWEDANEIAEKYKREILVP